jgi:hypothetical protein
MEPAWPAAHLPSAGLKESRSARPAHKVRSWFKTDAPQRRQRDSVWRRGTVMCFDSYLRVLAMSGIMLHFSRSAAKRAVSIEGSTLFLTFAQPTSRRKIQRNVSNRRAAAFKSPKSNPSVNCAYTGSRMLVLLSGLPRAAQYAAKSMAVRSSQPRAP